MQTKYNRTIQHGIPENDHFAIMQPCYETGGSDCSCMATGIGLSHTLVNPVTKTEIQATLINRRYCYTDSDLFESLSFMIYGKCGADLLDILQARYQGMIAEIVEIWVFKKDK